VTSNLDFRFQKADHRQGGGRARRIRGTAPNSFVLKTMTSNPVGAEDLAEHFCEPAPVKAFTRYGEGVPSKLSNFPEMKLPRVSLEVSLRDFFARKIHSFSGPESALNHAVTAPHTIVSITKRKAHPYG
jgi:hypothetical protein